MESKAAILKEFDKSFEIDNIRIKEAKGEGVIIRVEGAGMCRTDLRIWKGTEPRPGLKLPFVLGHENAGTVVEVGDEVQNLKKGDKVIVYAVWGDQTCKYCREGKFMLCKNQTIPGQSFYYGGFSEYMYVPSFRFLYKINIDPVIAAPLADAGLTSYAAVKKSLRFLKPSSTVILYGFGGLGIYALQALKVLGPYVNIIAVARSEKKLDLIQKLGAVPSKPGELKSVVNNVSNGNGASVAIDFVGNEDSTMNISKNLESGGAIIEVGMEGKTLRVPTFDSVVWEYELIGSNYGTINELGEVVNLTERGLIKPYIIKRKLEEINDAMHDLEKGEVLGRQVIIP